MLNKKCLGAVMLAAMAASTTAMADDRGLNTLAGAAVGAAIGHNSGGRNGAGVGGLVGAAIGNSLSTGDRGYYNSGYVETRASYGQPVYYAQPEPVYYEQPRVVTYVEPRPVYYAPRYYGRSEVIYVERGYGYHGYHGDHGYRGHHGHRD